MAEQEPRRGWAKVAAGWAGPLLALLAHAAIPAGALPEQGRAVAALAAWMALWWLTEAVPVAVTALLPLALLPLAGLEPKRVAAPYAHPLVFLFLGGFLVALCIERWNLHRRIALRVLLVVGTSPRALVGGTMAVTALLSMWTSNTASAVVMLPIVRSLVEQARAEAPGDPAVEERLPTALALSVAYAATIGGLGTLVGTAPNLFLASFASEQLGVQVDFAHWMLVGVPLVLVLLPLCWWLLVGPLFRLGSEPLGSREGLRAQLRGLGPLSAGERAAAVVFVSVALLWTLRPWLAELRLGASRPFSRLTDASIALLGGTALFLWPVGRGERAMRWEDASRIPWGVLLLFGGGLSLASALKQGGVTEALGQAATALAGLPPWLVLSLVTVSVVLLTELTSNTATTTTLVPLVAAVAPSVGLEPLQLAAATALAASCAFMLPVATPPNAIVFGSGYVTMAQMRRAGLLMNLVAAVLLPLAAAWLVPWALTRQP